MTDYAYSERVAREHESHAVVIVSDEYRQEQQALVADPIITRMASDVVEAEGSLEAAIAAAEPPDFTQLALNGYKMLGGDQHFSIGGPANAIRATLVKLRDATREVERGGDGGGPSRP